MMPAMDPDTASHPSLTYLALGDSYTIGEAVDSTSRWPVQLARKLRGEGIPLADPRIVARTGWTTDELAAGMDSVDLNPPYDMVSLLIGVNNQYRGRSLEEFRDQFAELLDRAVALAGGDPERVLVLSIPDWGVMPFAEGRDREAIAEAIDAFNEAVLRRTLAQGAHHVDVTAISREAATDTTLVAPDGLHPSGRQYARWVDEVLPAAVRVPYGTEEG